MESLILLICLQVWEGRDADVEKLRSELDRMMDEALKLALPLLNMLELFTCTLMLPATFVMIF